MQQRSGLSPKNIYISGSYMGLSKKRIDRILDDIIYFAELEEFIDTPELLVSSFKQEKQ